MEKLADCQPRKGVRYMMPIILPVFRGYTVDERLHEFRKVNHGSINESPSIEFVAFDSPKGRRLLKAWLGRSRR
jgi:hypothetical protein